MGLLRDLLRRQPKRRPPHPARMFCAATLEKYRRGDQTETSKKWDAIRGCNYGYEMLKDTVLWSDEDPGIECRVCYEVLANLVIWRRHRWGEPPSGLEDRSYWDAVKQEFPEWPGFLRATMPDYAAAVLEEGRAGTTKTLSALSRAARRLKPKPG